MKLPNNINNNNNLIVSPIASERSVMLLTENKRITKDFEFLRRKKSSLLPSSQRGRMRGVSRKAKICLIREYYTFWTLADHSVYCQLSYSSDANRFDQLHASIYLPCVLLHHRYLPPLLNNLIKVKITFSWNFVQNLYRCPAVFLCGC